LLALWCKFSACPLRPKRGSNSWFAFDPPSAHNVAMILYHFTSLWNLRNVGPDHILAAGLKAMPACSAIISPS
jgi:hypothetical protein